MRINLQKTNILMICATAKYTFILRGEAIAIVKTTKYLGVMVTDALSWKSQYAFTMKRARSAMGTIAEIVANPYFDIDLKLEIWWTKVVSSLYGCEVWHFTKTQYKLIHI